MNKNGKIQILNPKINRYVLVDIEKGVLLKNKKTKGPYKGVTIIFPPGKRIIRNNLDMFSHISR